MPRQGKRPPRKLGKDQAPTQLARSISVWPSEAATHKAYDAIFRRWLNLYAARNARALGLARQRKKDSEGRIEA